MGATGGHGPHGKESTGGGADAALATLLQNSK